MLWKGSWRWFSERMLDCCVDLEEIKVRGNVQRQAAICDSRWRLRLVETGVWALLRSRVFWKATDCAPSFELSIVQIGRATTEL